MRWRLADVTDTRQVDPDGSLPGQVGLVLDNGCLHGIPTSGRRGWAATVNHLALPAANLLVRAAMPARRGSGPAGIAPTTIAALLGDRWKPAPPHGYGWYHYRMATG